MTKEETRACVLRMYAAFNTSAFSEAGSIFAADFYSHPLGGGIDAVKKSWAATRKAFPRAQVIVEDMIIDGNKVASFTRIEGISTDNGNKIPHIMEFIHLSDGRITELWGLTDMTRVRV